MRIAHTIAEVALELNPAIDDRAASPTRPLQVLTKIFQKGPVLRESGHYGHRLSAAPLLLQPQLGDDPTGDGFVVGMLTAFTIARRPAASRAHASKVGGIHETSLPIRLSSVSLHANMPIESTSCRSTHLDADCRSVVALVR